MSLEHALNNEIRKLKGQLGGMVREVDQYRQTMENAQAGLARTEEALTSQRALISYLEMSLEEATEPEWKKGDRFRWIGYPSDPGEITGIDASRVYVRSDKGNVITMDRSEFARLVERA